MQFEIPIPTPKTSVWDNAVPIVQSNNVTHVYLTDEIMEPAAYNELCHRLDVAAPHEIFRFKLNTPGGHVDSALMITDAMRRSNARCIGHLSGTVASAGTIITLSCDEIEVAPHTAWMSHNYSSGMMGKGHELKARQEFVDESLNRYFREIHRGFFTPEEIEDILEGRDIWMGTTEILARWAAKQAYVPVEGDTESPVTPRRKRRSV